MPIRTRRKNKKVECRKESEPFKNGAVSFCAKKHSGSGKMVSFPFLGINYKLDSKESIKYEKIAKIRKNEEIREIKSYHERKKENYKIHAFAK